MSPAVVLSGLSFVLNPLSSWSLAQSQPLDDRLLRPPTPDSPSLSASWGQRAWPLLIG